jgi:Zn finger protein HypA/HybF involved in hydrogenase expression
MHLNYFTYKQQDIECSNCAWRGKGRDLVVEEIREEHWIIDLACPQCGHHVGFVQSPLVSEVEAWKQDHPEWTDD